MIVLYEPNKDDFRHADAATAVTATLADYRNKAAMRQNADAASQAAAKVRADGVKPAL